MEARLGGTTLREQLQQFLREAFLFGPEEELRDDMSLLGSGILDSTGVLELVTHLEEFYGIEVRDEEIVPDNLDSVDRLCRFVAGKTSG